MKLISEHPVDLNDGAVLKLWRFQVAAGERDAPHAHNWPQLDWAPAGVLTVDVDQVSWVVPPTVAFWIPGGVRHAVGASRPADLRHVTFYPRQDDRLTADPFDKPIPVAMTPFMIEVLDRLGDPGLDAAMRGRLGEVFVDAMAPGHRSTVRLPLPRDERALTVARHLMTEPADQRHLAEWGRHVGASRRTLVRVFAGETGLSWVQWRTLCRVQAALPKLASGAPVTVVAHEVGYQNVSSFIAAFRRTVGLTPGEYQHAASTGPRNGAR